MRNDLLSDTLSAIKNAEFLGKPEVTVSASKLTKEVLRVMQEKGYVGEFELIDDKRGGKLKIKLLGKINVCGSIKPRHSVQIEEYVKWEKRYLPAKDYGALVISTSRGVMSHDKASDAKIGGALLAYVY